MNTLSIYEALRAQYPEVSKYLQNEGAAATVDSLYAIEEDSRTTPRKGWTLFHFFQKLLWRPDRMENLVVRDLMLAAYKKLNTSVLCEAMHTQIGGANECLKDIVKGCADLSPEFIRDVERISLEATQTILQRTQPKPIPKPPVPLDPSITKDYGIFPEERCVVAELGAKAAALREKNYHAAGLLLRRLNQQTFENPQLEINEGINATHKQFPKSAGIPKFNCTDIKGKQQFLFTTCPKDQEHAEALFTVLLMRGGSLLVSTLEANEALHRWNNFWKKDKVEPLRLQDGWMLTCVAEKVLATGSNPGKREPKIIETTLEAKRAQETRIVTHLHYDGWIDNQAAPDERIFLTLLLRMKELAPDPHAPISINCRAGVGRTGTTGMCLELMREIDCQVNAGVPFTEISINVVETLYAMRMNGRRVVGSPAAFSQIYAMMSRYCQHLVQQQVAVVEELKPVAQAVAERLF